MSLVESLGQEVATLALCWKLSRRDGMVLGLTSHDCDLLVDGVRYVARPGLTPSAVGGQTPWGAGTVEIEGALSSAALSAIDLQNGRWADALVEMFLCDWTQPEQGRMPMLRGRLGEISETLGGPGRRFGAELASEPWSRPELPQTVLSPTCRADLGDARCGVDLTLYQRDVAIGSVVGREVHLSAALPQPERYAGGVARFLDGSAAGLDRRILRAEADRLQLDDPVDGLSIGSGRLRLTEGCDKRFATCRSRFANGAAFDGEPYVPGTDALVRYGGV